jgi:hypothetical protein
MVMIFWLLAVGVDPLAQSIDPLIVEGRENFAVVRCNVVDIVGAVRWFAHALLLVETERGHYRGVLGGVNFDRDGIHYSLQLFRAELRFHVK